MKQILLSLVLTGSLSTWGQHVDTLLANLEYPRALHLDGNKVYFTETSGTLSVFGGKVTLNEYLVDSGQVNVLVNNLLICSNTIVMDTAGSLYLGCEVGSSVGELGWVTQYVPSQARDTVVKLVEIAVSDMRLSPYGDVLLTGLSDLTTAKSIYQFDSGDFLSTPSILQTGLRRVHSIVQRDSTVYFVNNSGIHYFGPDGVVHILSTQNASAIDYHRGHLYYADAFGGTIGRINVDTFIHSVLLWGLREPVNLRIDTTAQRLYFLEAGTYGANYLDGTLQVMDIAYLSVAEGWSPQSTTCTIYPNPTIDGLLTITNVPDGSSVTVTNVLGQTVYQTQTNSAGMIDLTGVGSGTYLLHLHRERGQSSQQVLVKQ